MKNINHIPVKVLAFICFCLAAACSKKDIPVLSINTSASGLLSRFDLASSDYDVLPVTTFVVSYDQSGKISNQFEKSGQTLFSYSLSYTGGKLSKAVANNLGVHNLTYNTLNKVGLVNYTTITDTGKMVFSYDAGGKLIAMLDSVKQPNKLAARYQYLFTYDAGGNNVIKITKNQLDLQGRPTLVQYNFYTFDNAPNPFTGFPYLQNSAKLPGGVPALINKNNVIQTQIVGTIFNTSGGGSAPQLDTVTNYRSIRKYEYSSSGLPLKAVETFKDVQFNYSGSRTFTYDY